VPLRDDQCPCGSGSPYDLCCAPILEGALATTALALMRSRYSAFAVGRSEHLQATWHPSTRPSSIELDDGTEWRRLQIVDTVDGEELDEKGVVEFRAVYRDAAGAGVLHERSRFVRENGRWLYLDGVAGG